MNFIGNFIWLLFGGLISALGYFLGGFILSCTIIGIPFGLQCFKIGFMVLMPFGSKVVSDSSSTGCLSVLFNIIWLFSGGLYTALMHLLFGFLLSITIIGLPWGRQHFKLVELSLMPFGKRIVAE
ncbi:YccF domain-containing protein [Parasediminibacterium paludis]|uniref:YccF domain-containing protein n=1 Tax=Parasediminibacterium paludis TaxID=908966 RepID=A0ABV8PW99_9BACT